MKLQHQILASSLATLVAAQSAPDFPIEVTEYLPITYTETDARVSPPGVLLPRSDVLEVPTVFRPAPAANGVPYVLFMIDQDVPRNGSRVPLLHWLQPNFVATTDAFSVVSVMDGASTAIGAEYRPPTPPADEVAHRYTFLLFEQPALWTIPASYVTINPPADTSARIGFNITDFVAASGLGEPIAANYLRVLNGTAAETSSLATETYVAPTSVPSSSTPAEASATASATTSPAESATSEAGSATSAAPSETAAATDGAMAMRGSTKELLVGLAMGVAGAGLWMMG